MSGRRHLAEELAKIVSAGQLCRRFIPFNWNLSVSMQPLDKKTAVTKENLNIIAVYL